MTSRWIDVPCIILTAMAATGCFKPDDESPSSGTETEAGSTSSGDDTLTATATVTVTQTASATETETSATSVTTVDASTDEGSTTPDPDESSTAPTTLETTDTTTEPPAECGNGVVEAREACDDGVNAGADVGDCAPDCSTEVELREIVSSATLFDGDLAGAGPGSVIENLDDGCPFGFLAMFSDGADRIASETANTGDGQVDWVLAPWTAYINDDGDLLAITDGAALLGVHGGAFMALANAITPGDNGGRWTGLNQDWTAMGANENCNNWTNATNNYQMMMGSPGATSAQFLRQSQDFTYPCGDQGAMRPIYCAEQ